MKKLAVALTVVIFLVALALPAMATNGYHRVFKWEVGAWVETDEAEMFSKLENKEQYRFSSRDPARPCYPFYVPPEPEDPIQKTIINRAHLFPWIDIHFNQTELIWDLFKPGCYMTKAFMIKLRANCPVQVHYGAGTFPAPVDFEDGQEDGKIIIGTHEKEDVPENALGDKEYQYSLLTKPADKTGTPEDVIDVYWWWKQGEVSDWDLPHEVTNVVPDQGKIADPFGDQEFPNGWVRAAAMNSMCTVIPDSEELHVNKYLVFYENLKVEPCDSEGKYLEEFVISICPDP